MSKENLKTVKSLIDQLMLSVEEKIEDSVKLEITYKELVVGAEVMEGDVVAPDGEYEVEDGVKITVVDGKISEIKKPEDDEVIPGTTENLAVEVEEVPPVLEGLPEQIADSSESGSTEETPKVADVLNIGELEKLIDITKLENAYCTISFSVYEGKILWGEVYTSDYKQLLSKQENQQKELEDLKSKIKQKDELILELGKAVEKQPALIQAPVEENDVKLSRQELIKLKIQENKK